MSMASTVFKGIVHGKTIELDEQPGLPDGQEVIVRIETAVKPIAADPLEALKRAAGSWSDDPEGLAEFLEWNRQPRKISRELPG